MREGGDRMRGIWGLEVEESCLKKDEPKNYKLGVGRETRKYDFKFLCLSELETS